MVFHRCNALVCVYCTRSTKRFSSICRSICQMLMCWNNATINYYNSRTIWILQATGFVVGVCFIIFINPTLRRSAADRGKWKVWRELDLLLERRKRERFTARVECRRQNISQANMLRYFLQKKIMQLYACRHQTVIVISYIPLFNGTRPSLQIHSLPEEKIILLDMKSYFLWINIISDLHNWHDHWSKILCLPVNCSDSSCRIKWLKTKSWMYSIQGWVEHLPFSFAYYKLVLQNIPYRGD